jgi:hypothetical protein
MTKSLPVLLLLFVIFSSCKKDPYSNSPSKPQQGEAVNLISTDALKGWFAANAIGNYVKPDWSKAQQKNVNGVSIVKVPVKNLYNAGVSEVKKQSLSKGFNSAGSVDTLHFFNPNHPPMLFFIKDSKASGSDSVKALMMNFIPNNPNIDNGKDNIWTGTLIEWNMRDEKVLFQTLKKSYVEHVGSITQSQMSDYQNAALNKGATQYKPMNFLRDIWNAIKWVVEAVGYFFGVPGDYNYFYHGRLEGCDFLWGALCGGGGSNGNVSNSGGWYNGFGSVYDGVYSGYINGYNGFINDGWNGYDGDDMDQDDPCPPANGGMSVGNHQTLGAISSNGCPIYKPVPIPTPAALLILTLAITDASKSSFLHSNASIAIELNNYLQTNGITPETIDFVNVEVAHLVVDAAYTAFVNNHVIASPSNTVWWQDDNWLDNTNFSLSAISQDDPYKRLNAEERRTLRYYPYQGYLISKNKPIAESKTEQIFGRSGLNDKSDAFRHAFFNAMNERDCGKSLLGMGPSIAKMYSDAHESETPPSQILEKEMDIFNNTKGQAIPYISNITRDNDTFVNIIYQMLVSGALRYLSPLDFNQNSRGIIGATQIVPTNQ